MGIVDSIKKEAKGNRTALQSTEASELSKIFNAMFFLPKNIAEETLFVQQVMTRGLKQQERVGLHASALIVGEKEYCVRAQVLSLLYKQLQGEQISAGLKRIFEEGNAIHEKWQRMFIRAGYSKAKHLDVSRYNEEYMISYTPDILCKIVQFYDGVMVGEIKSVNTFQFQKMVSHPSAKKQLQWYMHLTKVHKGFVLCEDKNTQEFRPELYDYDRDIVATPIERAEEIVYYYGIAISDTPKMVKRPTDAKSPACKRCEKCNMRNACWNIGYGKVRLTQSSSDNVQYVKGIQSPYAKV